MLCLNHIEDRTFISLYKVHFLDYDLKQVQNKVFYKSDKKTCKCKTAPASSYHHLFPAWLTRTLRSNVFCLLLPAETTACYANRQEAPPPPPPLFVEASQALLLLSATLWQMHAARHHRLSRCYRSWFITLLERRIFIYHCPWHVYKPLRDSFQSLPFKLYMCFLIIALFTFVKEIL